MFHSGVEMASTGEMAAFGTSMEEAYWASITSSNAFRVPAPRSGVLIGGNTKFPQLATVAKGLSDLGFKLYCSSKEIEDFIAGLPYVTPAERVEFPLKGECSGSRIGTRWTADQSLYFHAALANRQTQIARGV